MYIIKEESLSLFFFFLKKRMCLSRHMSRKRLQWCCDEKCKGMLSFPDVVERASPPCPVRGEGICSISWPTILFLKKKKKEIQTFSAKNIWRLVPEHVLSDVLITFGCILKWLSLSKLGGQPIGIWFVWLWKLKFFQILDFIDSTLR